MECKNCLAYGIDSLNFHGCLIKQPMLNLKGKTGCGLRKKTINTRINVVKNDTVTSEYYQWTNLEKLLTEALTTPEATFDRSDEIQSFVNEIMKYYDYNVAEFTCIMEDDIFDEMVSLGHIIDAVDHVGLVTLDYKIGTLQSNGHKIKCTGTPHHEGIFITSKRWIHDKRKDEQ